MPLVEVRRPRGRSAEESALGRAERFHVHAVTAILAWGVVAFGAVYPWGYQPLAVACAIVGGIALVTRRLRTSGSIAVALAAVAIAVILQVVSLPAGALQRFSPTAVTLLSRYDLAFALQPGASHSLSIDPSQTLLGLFLVVCFGVFFLGLAAVLERRLIARLLQSVIGISFIVALVALVLSGNHSGRVYGFWQPQSPGAPFGPFVNRNHYAGWMLMSTLAGFGYFCALLNDAGRTRTQSWRERAIWLSTPGAARVVWVAIALTVMALSILISMSRSGIACLGIGFAVMGVVHSRKGLRGWVRAGIVAALLVFSAASVAWAGADRLAVRFSTWQDDSLGGRLAIWRDARQVIREFPAAGTGFNTFGTAMRFYQTTHLQEHYAEAHNDYLQIAAEGGLLIGIPALALVVVFVRTARRRLRETLQGSRAYWIRVGALTAMLAVMLQDAADFSLQIPGNAALFCLLAAVAVHRSSASQVRPL